jgi:hypothetical protein
MRPDRPWPDRPGSFGAVIRAYLHSPKFDALAKSTRENYGRPLELARRPDVLGVLRKWYQGDHYDIALSKKVLAIAAGAREITRRQLSCMAMMRRFGLPVPSPENAEDAFCAAMDERKDAPAQPCGERNGE